MVNLIMMIANMARELAGQLLQFFFPSKEPFETRVRREYEAHHGEGSLWFSGALERGENEASTSYLARRYCQTVGSLMAAHEVKEIAKKYIKANVARTAIAGAITGALMAVGLSLAGGWMQIGMIILAAATLGIINMIWFRWGDAPILRTLTQAGPGKSHIQKAAKLASEVFIRDQAIDAPEDLKDIYRIPFLDKNGKPVSDRFFESDLTEDYYAAAILSGAEKCRVALASTLIFASLAGLFLASFFVIPEIKMDGRAIVMMGLFSILYLFGFAILALEFGRYKIKTEPTQASEHRAEILEVLSNGSADQLALQSGVSAAISQENKARDEQVSIAKKDTSPFFELGRSTGFLHQRYDQFAPSIPQMPVGLTFNDLSTHLLILGGTGAGKTSGTIRPLIRQWLANNQGGMLVLDGKGQLPAEIQSDNYTLLTPDKIKINPIEGLRPDDVAETIENLSNDGGQSSDPYWTNAAAKLIRSLAHTVYALSEKGDMPYNLASIYSLLSDTDIQSQARNSLSDDVIKTLSGSARRGIRYALVEFPAMPEKQRGSIEGIASLWLSQITDNEEMASWAEAVNGYPVESVTTGARIGVLLPEARYGKAGVLVSGLLKKRVYEAIKRRGDTWQKEEGQTAVLVVIDEVQELLTDDETNMLPIARSLGLYAAFSTQNIDGILKKLGDHAGYQLLGNLRSLVAFQTQTEKTTAYISERMGSSYRPQITQSDCYADTYSRIRKAADGTAKSAIYDEKIGVIGGARSIGMKLAGIPSQAISFLKNPEDRYRRQESWGSDNTYWRGVRDNANIDIANNVERFGRHGQSISLNRNVTADEVNEALSQPNTAFCQVMRGRVVRRDLIVTKPIYEMGE